MKFIDKLLSQQEVPLIRNFWLRFIKYFVVVTIISYFLYSQLAQVNLDAIQSLNNKRSAMAFLMLSIMSAKSWGWFSFIGCILTVLWGDWQNLRWQSFPKEQLNGEGVDESDFSEGN